MQTGDAPAGNDSPVAARARFGNARLCVLITEALCRKGWLETAEAALAGGADVLQLREKELPDRELLRRARRLASLCYSRNALLIVNDRPDLAVLSHADGVHLGQDDLAVGEARRIVSSAMLVGVSTHTGDQVRAAVRAAPDYIAVGPMFASGTKVQDHIAGPSTLAVARRATSLPLAAIGGIGSDNARAVLAAAVCCVCVCGAVISQPDPQAAAAALRFVIDEACGAGLADK